MRIFGPRMTEVYGRNKGNERLWFIGYCQDGTDLKKYAADHVSDASGEFLSARKDDELKGFVIEFGPPPCLAPTPDYECQDCIGMKEHGCYCQSVGAVAPGGPLPVADEQRTNPGTFPGTAGVEW